MEPDNPYGVSKSCGGICYPTYIPAHMARILSACGRFLYWPGRGSNVFVDLLSAIVEVERGGADGLGVGTCLQSGISSTSGMPSRDMDDCREG